MDLAEDLSAVWFDKLFKRNKPDLKEEAALFVQQRNWDKALAAWSELVRKEPKNKEYLMTLSEILVKKGQKGRAFSVCERILQLFLEEGQEQEAITLLRKIQVQTPGDERPRERLVRLLMQISAKYKGTAMEMRYRDQALVELRQMAAEKQSVGKSNLTLRYLRAVADLDPRDLGTARQVVALLRKEGRDRQAISFLRAQATKMLERRLIGPAEKLILEALKVDNGNPGMKALYFYAQMQEGYGYEAQRGLERLHSEHPEDLEVVQTLARIEMERGRNEVAANWLIVAFNIDKTQTVPLMELGRKMLADGKPGVAFNLFKPVAEHACLLGKPDAAISLMSDIIKMDRDHLPTLRVLLLYSLRAQRHDDAVYFLDRVVHHHKRQHRLSDCQEFLRTLLSEFSDNKLIWSSLQLLNKTVEAA